MPGNDPLKPAREAAAALVRQVVGDNPQLQQSPTRDDLVKIGKSLWEQSYAITDNDKQAFDLLADLAQENVTRNASVGGVMIAASLLYLPMEQITYLGCARWADQAFPTIQMGHKYAAALLSTSVSPEDLEDLKAPFKAFLIEVPDKLLSCEDPRDKKLYDFRYILAHQITNSNGLVTWNYVALSDGRISLWKHGISNEMLLEGEMPLPEGSYDWSTYSFGVVTDDRDAKLNFLIGRLIVNTCLAMGSEDNVREVGKSHKTHPYHLRECAEPVVRTYVVGKPLKLDCREGVQRYLDGHTRKGSSPTVQTLVTGHWKGQPYGPRNSLRKRIWRQPYWRGPEDAPILVRPRVMSHDDGVDSGR
jgi:hypothetical protein